MSNMMTIHVLGFGELYQQLLNAIAAFMKLDGFWSLLRLTALIGIIMASVGYLKERNPFCYVKWLMGYVLVCNLAILPKTSVMVYDISAQDARVVDNVPVVFAATASLITTVGVGLAETYDALLSLPDDLTYTKTGSLFGARMIQAAHDFKIIDPQLKTDMNAYFRNCVVGDIQLNHKYSVSDLSTNLNIWELISKKPSPVRMTQVGGTTITCVHASKELKTRLDAEIKNAYTFFGISLFGHARKTTYETLFNTYLSSSFNYYQHMTDSAANIFLQSMMINAISDGINHYQALTDNAAGVLNHQVTKSQVQHRWSWAIAGQKATWFLPILHSLLTVLLFGLFPMIMVMATLPNGIQIVRGYLQFFVSLQFWPVLFAILNAAMTMYGASQSQKYGGLAMVNLEKLDELHSDLSGVAGYLMLLIPFLAKGLVSSLSDAFSNLATSMTSHLQGSAMSVAGEAASASFSLGQTSFYNTSANNFSANKHDNNWTHMHGMHAEQLGTGAIKTHTGSGETVFDVSPAMTRGAISINTSNALSGSLNQAFEESKQAAENESTHYQTSLSQFAHKAVQLSELQGHEMRLGAGVSESESSQYSQAISTMTNIAHDVAQRLGVSTEDALSRLTNAGLHWQVGVSSDRSILGTVAKITLGAQGGADVHGRAERTSSSQDRYHEGTDSGFSMKEAHDFNSALNYTQHFTQTHHFDESASQGASLSKQMGADLREAQTASHNVEASLSRASRISRAQHYAESHSAQVNTDLNQAFPQFVVNQVGVSNRDQLFSHPGDSASLHQLDALGQDFISQQRETLISKFGNQHEAERVDAAYNKQSEQMLAKTNELRSNYQKANASIVEQSQVDGLGIDKGVAMETISTAHQHIEDAAATVRQRGASIENKKEQAVDIAEKAIDKGKANANKGAVFFPFKED